MNSNNSNNNNENNFGFVYYTDPRVAEAQRVHEEVIAHCRKNVAMISKEMNELKALLAAVTMKYKVAEDARRVMYKRNSLLMDDNEFLKEKLRETEALRAFAEKSKCRLEKEAKEKGDTVRRLETALKEIISEGVQDKKKRRALLFRDRTTSTTELENEQHEPALLEDGNQNIINEREVREAEKPLEDLEDDKTSETTSMVQSEDAMEPTDAAASAAALEEKPLFDQDENKHKKKAPHEAFRDIGNIAKEPEIKEPKDRETGRAMDRFRHVRLVKVMQELERQKHMNSWKNSELNNKTRELKMRDAELAGTRKEIMTLKNKLSQNSVARMRLNAKRRIENAANNAKKFVTRQDAKDCEKTPNTKKDNEKEKEKEKDKAQN